jgi:hypothetical protein
MLLLQRLLRLFLSAMNCYNEHEKEHSQTLFILLNIVSSICDYCSLLIKLYKLNLNTQNKTKRQYTYLQRRRLQIMITTAGSTTIVRNKT